MSRKYLTDLGPDLPDYKPRQKLNKDLVDAVKSTHDLLTRAAEDGMDVAILAGSMRAEFRDEFFATTTGKPFSDCLRAVLAQGGNVQILLWTEVRPGVLSPTIKELIDELGQNPSRYPGEFDVRISTTRRASTPICHFIVARGDNHWLLRLEEPHEPREDLDQRVNGTTMAIPSAVMIGLYAEEDAKRLLKTFETLFNDTGAEGGSLPLGELV